MELGSGLYNCVACPLVGIRTNTGKIKPIKNHKERLPDFEFMEIGETQKKPNLDFYDYLNPQPIESIFDNLQGEKYHEELGLPDAEF